MDEKIIDSIINNRNNASFEGYIIGKEEGYKKALKDIQNDIQNDIKTAFKKGYEKALEDNNLIPKGNVLTGNQVEEKSEVEE